MKIPSRRMLAAPVQRVSAWGYLVLALILIGAGFIIYKYPYLLLVLLALAVFGSVVAYRERQRFLRLKSTRSQENICSFVRSFDYRHTDTWVLRAVYEELSRFLEVDGQPFPIRADDYCCGLDLKIDPEDFEDLASDIAMRAGRSMDNSVTNPYYGKVHTVRDLVGFLNNQPKLSNATAIRATEPNDMPS
jgi:hypothetical protein